MQAGFRNTVIWLAASLWMLFPAAASALEPAAEELSRECVYGEGDCENGFGILEIRTELGTDRYEGNFQDGEFHGYGKYERMVSRSERAYYDGHWENGLRDGRGTYWDGRSQLYIGEWEDGMRHGEGSYFYGLEDWTPNRRSEHWLSQNTENYTGEFVRGMYQGEGTYRWPDGRKYVGEFYANDKHGRGVFHFSTGTVQPQEWEYGERVDD